MALLGIASKMNITFVDMADWHIRKLNVIVFAFFFFFWNCRYEALLFLKRLNFQETGRYTLHVKSSIKNASITFDIKMYSKYSKIIFLYFSFVYVYIYLVHFYIYLYIIFLFILKFNK